MLKNLSHLFIARATNAISLLCLTLIISRVLGPEIFGAYSFLNSVIMTGGAFAVFGLDVLMVREAITNNGNRNEIFSTIIFLKICFSAIVILAINIIFRNLLSDPALLDLLTCYSVVICLNSISQTLWHIGDTVQEYKVHACLWAISNLIKLPFALIFITIEQNLAMVIYALVLAEVFSLSATVFFTRKTYAIAWQPIEFNHIRRTIKKAGHIGLIFLISVIYFRIDMMMLEVMKGEKSVGLYAAAYKIIEFISIIPGTVCIVALPQLSVLFEQNFEKFTKDSKSTIFLLSVLGIGIACATTLLSHQIIIFLFGDAYEASVLTLIILSSSIIFIFLNGYFSYMAVATKNEKKMTMVLMIAACMNIVLNWYAIPIHGPNGAAIATVATEAGIFGMCILIMKWKPTLLRKSIAEDG